MSLILDTESFECIDDYQRWINGHNDTDLISVITFENKIVITYKRERGFFDF